MEDYGDIYYVDSRNAVSRHYDPRPSAQRRPYVPGGRVPTQTYYVRPEPRYQQQGWIQGPPQSTAAMMLGKLTTGQIVEMVAQVFAALQSLPGAPVSTRDLETDVSNLILYQGALAAHAKRDEQVRTLGSLVAKLVG